MEVTETRFVAAGKDRYKRWGRAGMMYASARWY